MLCNVLRYGANFVKSGKLSSHEICNFSFYGMQNWSAIINTFIAVNDFWSLTEAEQRKQDY